MTFDANTLLMAIISAFSGFLLKYIWDRIIKKQNENEEKVERYDEQKLQETVAKIVKEMCIQFKGGLEESLNDFKIQAGAEFEHYKQMYWDAVKDLRVVEKDFNHLREQDLAFYKYQLINSCKKYISQGFITQYQFDRLSELHKIYHDLGGNSQGDMYYEKATGLRIVTDNSYKKIDSLDDELFVTEADMMDIHAKAKKEED